MAFKRIRLQDLIATTLAVVFGLGLAATAWHLAQRYGEVAERVSNARQRFDELVHLAETGIAPHTVTLIENEIDELLRKRRVQEEAVTTANVTKAFSEAEHQRLREEAKTQGLEGLGPFDAGQEPKRWYPHVFSSAWWKWKARSKLIDGLNKQYYKHQQTIETVKSVIIETRKAVAAVDADVSRLRDRKNSMMQILSDQSQRDKLVEDIRESTAAMTLVFLLHIPIALYFILLFVRAMFRLAILREWIGERRLCHAR